MQSKRALSAQDLKHALTHIKAFIFDERDIFDDAGQLTEALRSASVVFEDESDHAAVGELQTEIKHLRELVYRDELTGVLNRRGVMDRFGAFFDEALFEKQSPEMRKGVVISDFSIVFLDIDNFKKINDTYGHDEGDRVLKEVAQVLKHHMRDIDAVGRLGGEEFVAALLGAHEKKAFEKAEEIRAAIAQEIRAGDGASPITASIGIASLHQSDAGKLSELIEYADKAMYEAKTKRGKNNTVRHSEITAT